MVILCVAAIAQPIFFFAGPLLQAISKPHYLAIIEWGNSAVIAGSIAVAGELLKHQSFRGQVAGIAVARFLASTVLLLPFIVWVFKRFAGVRLSSMFKVMTPSLASSAIMAVVVVAVASFAQGRVSRPWVTIAFEIVFGAVTAAGVLLWADGDLRETVRGGLTRLRHPTLAVVSPSAGPGPSADGVK
jgi:hypothetical protein